MGKIFYIMGKSATGKDHLYEALAGCAELCLTPLVLYTTRPVRRGEQDGREYHFVSLEELERLRREGRIIEERVYETVHGPWHYFTADEGQFRLEERDYIGIGTLESFAKLKEYFGKESVYPLYIETEDGIRLRRAILREEKQEKPKYAEMCRRFLADGEDFSEEKLASAGISRRFLNNGEFADCLQELKDCIKKVQNTAVS
jgi:guanylate kinase